MKHNEPGTGWSAGSIAGSILPSKLFPPAVSILLGLMLAGFILSLCAGSLATGLLALHPDLVLRGLVWQLLTYPLINSGFGLVSGGLALLFVGGMIERQWGAVPFLLLHAVVAIACGLAWCLVTRLMGWDAVAAGMSPCTYGLIAVFGLMFKGRSFGLVPPAGIEGHHLAWIFIGIGIILSISQPLNLIWVGGAGAAWGFYRVHQRVAQHRDPGPVATGRPIRRSFIELD